MAKKYIDADILRKKIDEQMKSVPREVGRSAGTITSSGYGMMQAFQIIRSLIDSLQQEQPLPEDTVLFNKGVAEGRRLERQDMLTELDKSYKQAKRELEWFKEGKRQGREQMMKEVTECELVCFKDHLLAVLPMKEFRWTAGDKAKIIVIPNKEDKE